MHFNDQRAKAFNEGSDARIRGRLVIDNPYGGDVELGNQWRAGWWDVEKYWGAWAKKPVAPLPKVPVLTTERVHPSEDRL